MKILVATTPHAIEELSRKHTGVKQADGSVFFEVEDDVMLPLDPSAKSESPGKSGKPGKPEPKKKGDKGK